METRNWVLASQFYLLLIPRPPYFFQILDFDLTRLTLTRFLILPGVVAIKPSVRVIFIAATPLANIRCIKSFNLSAAFLLLTILGKFLFFYIFLTPQFYFCSQQGRFWWRLSSLWFFYYSLTKYLSLSPSFFFAYFFELFFSSRNAKSLWKVAAKEYPT